MNPEVKAKWVAALRSGEYKQTTGRLRVLSADGSSNAFCCLGVLCDLHAKNTGGDWDPISESSDLGVIRKYKGNTAQVPREVEKWSGLSTVNAVLLASINDSGASFSHIAKHIEKQL